MLSFFFQSLIERTLTAKVFLSQNQSEKKDRIGEGKGEGTKYREEEERIGDTSGDKREEGR